MKNNLRLLLVMIIGLYSFMGYSQVSSYFYGILEENEGITDSLTLVGEAEEGGHIYIWNGFSSGSGTPFFGDSVLSFVRNPDTWNGIGVQSDLPVDLSAFVDGYVRLALKTATTDKDFRIGIKDIDGGDWVVHFVVGEDPYGFERNGEWHELSIPIADFLPRDSETQPITADNLANMTVLFYLVGTIDVDIDEIYYAQGENYPVAPAGPIESYYYGLYEENESIVDSLTLVEEDEEGGHIYIWNGYSDGSGTPFVGDSVLSLVRNPDTWNGIGIQSDNPINLSNFIDGYIRLAIKSSSLDKDFRLGIKDIDGGDWVVHFVVGEDPYEFERNGEWHELSIPIADFEPKTAEVAALTADNLANMTVPFYMVGTVDVDLDEIYYAQGAEYPSSVSNKFAGDLQVYPNPASEYIMIQSSLNSEIRIINLAGETVMSRNLNGPETLDISMLNTGLYFVVMRTGNQVVTQKIIKR